MSVVDRLDLTNLAAVQRRLAEITAAAVVERFDFRVGTEINLEPVWDVPGFCQCGCGGRTSIVKYADASKGLRRGQRRRYLKGHQTRPTTPHFRVEAGGCWRWLRGTQIRGYGTAWRHTLAHRWVYERLVGPIPDGLTIDHLCRNKLCVNPCHMEPVTAFENHRRWVEWQRAR